MANLNKLIKWLKIPKNIINIIEFEGKYKKCLGYYSGDGEIYLNCKYVNKFIILRTLIHECIHYCFDKTQIKGFDPDLSFKIKTKNKSGKNAFIVNMLKVEQHTDLLAFLVLQDFLRKYNISGRKMKVGYLTKETEAAQFLYRLYFGKNRKKTRF